MFRGLVIAGTFAFCFVIWTGVYLGGVAAIVRGWQWFSAADASGVIATALTLGGLSMILIGFWLRSVAMTAATPDQLGFALAKSARFVVAIGAAVTFSGAGAVLANGVR